MVESITLVILVAIVAFVIGYLTGKTGQEPEPAEAPAMLAYTTHTSGGGGRYLVVREDGTAVRGDGATASECVEQCRLTQMHGKLYLDGKLAKEF